ncbi:DUF1659 domain-containing protein [Salibacterium salarium]|uniref:DUF1659 domain-containing protein n=1 Tax=Salibacterium salarium TaxID=284579 RepID=A0A428N312_9BACI|nr:DUF1659 domain-containing protein [Salibacterium salarium]RSL32716.1 DUF1659 domain-containing protein [Salibacterium salarium]
MAEMIDSRLTLEFNAGTNESGDMVFTYKRFNNVKTDAEDASLQAIASALGTLQQLPVIGVKRTNEYDIS